MSVYVSSQVWQRYPNGGGELTLALALADHSHDDGTHIWPSIEQLAKKTRQSVRTVQYQLRKMEAARWIVLINAGNGGRNVHREYVINPDWLNGADFASLENGANGNGNGATGDEKGATAIAPASKRKEPSQNRHSTARGTRLPETWQLPKKWGEWAQQEFPTWTVEHIRMLGEKFRDHWVASTGKNATKHDWLATWRNWCRDPRSRPLDARGRPTGGAWYASPELALAKANEVGVGRAHPGESDASWHARINAAIENGGKPPTPRASTPPAVPAASAEPAAPVVDSGVSRDEMSQIKGLLRSKGAALAADPPA
jgi:hypothetical protein